MATTFTVTSNVNWQLTSVTSIFCLYTYKTALGMQQQYPLGAAAPAVTLWAPSLGDTVWLTPNSSSVVMKANVADSRFPIQDPNYPTLSRREYQVIYNDITGSATGTPWKTMWATISGYSPVYSELSFVSGSAISGSISRWPAT